MTCALEDAGFEIRDLLAWVHPQGMSKSMDIAKAIDRMFFDRWLEDKGVEFENAKQKRETISDYIQGRGLSPEFVERFGAPVWGQPSIRVDGTIEPAHPEAKKHFGEGTLLRPVWEPIVLARKPTHGTLGENVIQYGTGSLNLNECRIPTTDSYVINRFVSGAKPFGNAKGEGYESVSSGGRLPTNILVEPGGSVDPDFVHIEGNPQPSKAQKRDQNQMDTRKAGYRFKRSDISYEESEVGDGYLGGYTRIFVIPKPSPKEKDIGLQKPNSHPTVKPVSLMRHLVRLVTPKFGIVLDPFMGSGTTGVACLEEERKFVGMEMTESYFEDAHQRIEFAQEGHMMSFSSALELLNEEG
jgi:site-specific DNA-methyltransferase (adenine-specific)